jgi:hypothetical protein
MQNVVTASPDHSLLPASPNVRCGAMAQPRGAAGGSQRGGTSSQASPGSKGSGAV